MKLSLPVYLVGLFVGLVYAIVKNYVPTIPLTEEQVMWFVLLVLAALNVDVTQALKAQGFLGGK